MQIGQVNNITLKSELGTESAEQTYEANVDNAPAIINVSVEPVVTTSGLTAKIRVSEPVNLTIERAKPTDDKPLRPTELEQVSVSANQAEIKWEAVDDVLEYAVYRDGTRIAIVSPTSTEYQDNTVGAGKNYQYQVASVSEQCVESDQSDIVKWSMEKQQTLQRILQKQT